MQQILVTSNPKSQTAWINCNRMLTSASCKDSLLLITYHTCFLRPESLRSASWFRVQWTILRRALPCWQKSLNTCRYCHEVVCVIYRSKISDLTYRSKIIFPTVLYTYLSVEYSTLRRWRLTLVWPSYIRSQTELRIVTENIKLVDAAGFQVQNSSIVDDIGL